VEAREEFCCYLVNAQQRLIAVAALTTWAETKQCFHFYREKPLKGNWCRVSEVRGGKPEHWLVKRNEKVNRSKRAIDHQLIDH